MLRMSIIRRSGAGVVLTFDGRSVKGTSVSPCARTGIAHSGMPSTPSPAAARPPLRISRRVLCVVMFRPPKTQPLSRPISCLVRRSPASPISGEGAPQAAEAAPRRVAWFNNAALPRGRPWPKPDSKGQNRLGQGLQSHPRGSALGLPYLLSRTLLRRRASTFAEATVEPPKRLLARRPGRSRGSLAMLARSRGTDILAYETASSRPLCGCGGRMQGLQAQLSADVLLNGAPVDEVGSDHVLDGEPE